MEHLLTWKIFPKFLKVKMKPSPRKAGSDLDLYIYIVFIYFFICLYTFISYHLVQKTL